MKVELFTTGNYSKKPIVQTFEFEEHKAFMDFARLLSDLISNIPYSGVVEIRLKVLKNEEAKK